MENNKHSRRSFLNKLWLGLGAVALAEAGLLVTRFFRPRQPRAALKEADFDSVRGDFKFGPNNHPIHDVYIREVIQEGDVFTNKIIDTVLEDHGDPYAAECQM